MIEEKKIITVIDNAADKAFDEPMNIEAILYADPRTLSDFIQTVSYISDWAYNVAVMNKENLITFANKAVENARKVDNNGDEYVALSPLITN